MNTQEQELHKRLIEQHQIWLKNPVTQNALQFIKEHQTRFDKALCDGIHKQSNKEQEDILRSGIKTCEAIYVVLSDSENFVKQLNNKQ